MIESSLMEFSFIRAEDTIFIRADDVLKMLELKKIYSNEDILKLGECFEKYKQEKQHA